MRKTRKELKGIIRKVDYERYDISIDNIKLKQSNDRLIRKLKASELEVSILKTSLKSVESVLHSNKDELAECLDANDALFNENEILIEERKSLRINLVEVNKLKTDLLFANKIIYKLIK